MENRILYNAIKTPDGTILESKNRYDFVTYTDKNGELYGVDGGCEYLRRIGNTEKCEDLSIMDDGKHFTRRQYLRWGRNYDENMNRLPITEWITIEKLTTDHIEAILSGEYSKGNSFFEQLFIDELNWRNENRDDN